MGQKQELSKSNLPLMVRPYRNGMWVGPEVSSILCADSFHGLFSNHEESSCQNNSYGLDETGKKQQARHKHHQANSLKQLVQGIGPRWVGRSGRDANAKGTGMLDISSANTSHDKLSNQIESSSKEQLTNRNNIAVGNGIKIWVHQPDYYKTACRVASKPRGMGSRRIRLKKKSHGQSMSKRELCGDAEGHGFKAAITVRIENGAATTRVNGRLRSTELEEVEKKVAELVKTKEACQTAEKKSTRQSG